jgi:hypothetical protein
MRYSSGTHSPEDFMILNILNHTGHTTHLAETPELIAEVEKVFTEHKAKGYLAYAGTDGDFTVIQDFDPAAEQITMSPQLVGG